MTAAASWPRIRLGDIGQSLTGLTYSPRNVNRSGTLVLRSSNIQGGSLAFDDNVYVNSVIPEKIRVRENDILICVRNGSRRLIGKSVLLDSRVVGETFGAFMAVYRSDANPFLRYFFQSDDFKAQIDEHLGATINQITNGSLNSFTVALPDAIEQAEIVARLRDVDDLIAILDHLIAKKQAIKQGMMQQLLTGRTRLHGFAGEWRQSTVGGEFDVQLGKRLDAAVNRGALKTCINNRGVRWGRILLNEAIEAPLTHADIQTLKLVPGDVLICEGGEIGRSAVWRGELPEAYFLNTLHRLRSKGDFNPYILAAFFERWVDTGELSAVVGKATLAHLTKENLVRVPVPVPGRDEQERIAAILTEADDELDVLRSRLTKTRDIKQGMMQQLLTGRTRLPVEVAS